MKTIRGADYCDIIPSARPFFRLRRTDRLWLRRHFRNVLRVFDRVVVVIIRRRRRFRDGSIGLDIGRTKTLPGTYTFVNKRTATTTVRSFTRSVNSSAPVFDVREKRTRYPPSCARLARHVIRRKPSVRCNRPRTRTKQTIRVSIVRRFRATTVVISGAIISRDPIIGSKITFRSEIRASTSKRRPSRARRGGKTMGSQPLNIYEYPPN